MDTGAILIGLAILLLSILFVVGPLQRKPRGRQAVSAGRGEHPDARRRMILTALRDLDFDYKIGKVIQEDHENLRNQLLSKAAKLMAESEAADQEIEAIIERRRQSPAKGAVHCPQCKGALSDGDLFCPSCGTAIARFCPACGKSTPPAAKFCSYCGMSLEREIEKSGEELQSM